MKSSEKKQNIAGLYIEDRKISVCQLKSGSETQVERIVDVPLPEGTVQKGIVLNPEVLIAIIKDTFRKNNIKTKKVAVTISDLPIITRSVVSPKVPKEKIKDALRGEVDKYMAGEEPLIDYYHLEKNRVLLFSIKKALADSLLSIIEKAGLDLVAIDIGLFSVLRTLINSNIEPTSEDTSMLGLVSSNKIEICIIRKGLPQYIHSVSIANTSNIAREIKLTKKSWQEESPQFPVKKIIILSSDTKSKNLHSELAKEIGNLELAQPLGSPPDEYNLSQIISLGLALGGKKAFPFDINFVPPEKYKEVIIKKRFLSIGGFIFPILIIFFITNLILSNIISSLKEKLVPLEQELNDYQNVLAEIEQIYTTKESLIRDINHREEFISQLKSLPLPQILEDIRKFIPKEVWLTKISHRMEGSIILTGKSLSEEAVYKYVNLLYFSDYFEEPKISSMTTKEEEGHPIVHFSILCPLLNEEENNED